MEPRQPDGGDHHAAQEKERQQRKHPQERRCTVVHHHVERTGADAAGHHHGDVHHDVQPEFRLVPRARPIGRHREDRTRQGACRQVRHGQCHHRQQDPRGAEGSRTITPGEQRGRHDGGRADGRAPAVERLLDVDAEQEDERQPTERRPRHAPAARGIEGAPRQEHGPRAERRRPRLRAAVHLPRGHRGGGREQDPEQRERRRRGAAGNRTSRKTHDGCRQHRQAHRMHRDDPRALERHVVAARGHQDLHWAECRGGLPRMGNCAPCGKPAVGGAQELDVVVRGGEPMQRRPGNHEAGKRGHDAPQHGSARAPAHGLLRRIALAAHRCLAHPFFLANPSMNSARSSQPLAGNAL